MVSDAVDRRCQRTGRAVVHLDENIRRAREILVLLWPIVLEVTCSLRM